MNEIYGILIVVFSVIYLFCVIYWQMLKKKADKKYDSLHPELAKIRDEGHLMSKRTKYLFELQAFKREMNRMVINLKFNKNLTTEQKDRLIKYIEEDEIQYKELRNQIPPKDEKDEI